MKRFSTKLYVVYIIIFLLIMVVFGGGYILLSDRFLSDAACESFINQEKEISLSLETRVSKDFDTFEDTINEIIETKTNTLDIYNELVSAKENIDFKYISDFNIAYADDLGYYINGSLYKFNKDYSKTGYYDNKVTFYSFKSILDDYNDNTNYTIFRLNNVMIYFNSDNYLYELLSQNNETLGYYFLICENNGGIAYQKDSTKTGDLYGDYLLNNLDSQEFIDNLYERKSNYMALTVNGKRSFMVSVPLLSEYTDNSYNLVYFYEKSVVIASMSYLNNLLIIIFLVIFILLAIGSLICLSLFIHKEQDMSHSKLRYFFVKPFVMIISKKGKIRYYNRTCEEIISKVREYRSILDFSFYDCNVDVLSLIKSQKSVTIQTKDKEDNRIFIRFIPLKTINGYTLLGEDITLPLHESIRNNQIALYNTVTNLPNKILLEKALNDLINEKKNETGINVLVAIDAIDFVKINRMFGFIAGDKMLKAVAEKLTNSIQGFDAIVYNIRTSVFMILFYDITNFNDIIAWSKDTLNEFSKPIDIKDNYLTIVEMKMGIYNINSEKNAGLTVNSIYDSAFSALERAKNSRLTKCAVYNSEFGQMLTRDQMMEQDLFVAIKQREFVMYYQPQYNTKIGKIVGFEALVRWNNPKYRYETVEHYITIAEKNGMIIDLGHIIIEETFRFAKSIEKTGIHISMNVSPAQLLHSGFVNDLVGYFEQYKLAKNSIAIEITETFLMENSEIIIEKLRILREKGFGIHLDDFGIGYSSMLYLKDLPIDTIKIDKDFTKNFVSDKFSRAIVTRIVQLALGLDLNIIAEGVENDKQMNMLSKIGCNVIQGYLISKPTDETSTLGLISKYNGTVKLSSSEINEQIEDSMYDINVDDETFVKPIANTKTKKRPVTPVGGQRVKKVTNIKPRVSVKVENENKEE